MLLCFTIENRRRVGYDGERTTENRKKNIQNAPAWEHRAAISPSQKEEEPFTCYFSDGMFFFSTNCCFIWKHQSERMSKNEDDNDIVGDTAYLDSAEVDIFVY